MQRHIQIKRVFSDFRKVSQKLMAAMDAETKEEFEPKWIRIRKWLRNGSKDFRALLSACKELYWYGELLREEIEDLEKTRQKYYNEINRQGNLKFCQKKRAIMTENEYELEQDLLFIAQSRLIELKKEVHELEQEQIIRQEELEIAIKETNLARNSYYRLTEKEMELFEVQRPKILAGIEKHGSIAAAIRNDATITLRASSIMHYAEKHDQFAQDIEIAKRVFKENLDAVLMDRALNGTTNPVFQKGEYIGDYAVKDNKLLVEVAKAKIPETYNPRAYAQANPQTHSGTTINILSFDGVDETKKGYARNIGVVKSVDDSGRVERITQAKKLVDFYKNKEGAEVIEAEVVSEEKDG